MKQLVSLFGLVALIAACGDDTSTSSGSGGSTSGSGGGSSEATGGAPGTTTSDAATTTVATTTSTASTSTGEGAGGPGSGGGGGDGSGGDGTGGFTPVDGPQGNILVSVYRFGSLVTDVLGTFDARSQCTVIDVEGGCVLSRCPTDPTPPLDAGIIAIDGGQLPATLEPPDYEEYPAGEAVTAGDVVTASTDGGADVPAFDLSATFPTHVVATEPSFESGSISSAEDLTVAWEGTSTDRVVVTASTAPEAEEKDEIACDAPMADGELTVPSSLLAQMETNGEVALSLVERAIDRVDTGEWTLTLTLSRYADAENGFDGDAFQLYDFE